MRHEVIIEYLQCRADFNFEVDCRVNGAIVKIVTKLYVILFGKWIIFTCINNTILFFNSNMPLNRFYNIYCFNLLNLCLLWHRFSK